ncbi:hypothetical protein BH11ARM1_BH11ARM1_16490 [soil metagenome]
MQRTDLQDTSEAAHQILVKRLREMTIEKKVELLNARIEEMPEMRKRTTHLRLPEGNTTLTIKSS